MRLSLFRVAVAVSLTLPVASSARASELLSLVNADIGITSYSLDFAADGFFTTVSFAGYQVASTERATSIGAFATSGTSNLLSQNWVFVPAASGSVAHQYNDGTSVSALLFGGTNPSFFDTFMQTFATTPDKTYSLDFIFTENGGSNAFKVSTSTVSATPIPGALPMFGTIIVGLIGLAGWKSRHRAAV